MNIVHSSDARWRWAWRLRGTNPEVLGEKPVPVPLGPLQIQRNYLGFKNWRCGDHLIKNRLNYDPDYVQNSPAAPSLTAPSSVPAASGLWRQDSGWWRSTTSWSAVDGAWTKSSSVLSAVAGRSRETLPMCRRPVIPWMRRDLLGAAFLSDKKGRHYECVTLTVGTRVLVVCFFLWLLDMFKANTQVSI